MNCRKLTQPALQKKSMSLEARVSQVVARVGVKRIAVFKKHAKKISGTKKVWVFKKYSGSKNIGSKKNVQAQLQKKLQH